jgi:hypothetical protein
MQHWVAMVLIVIPIALISVVLEFLGDRERIRLQPVQQSSLSAHKSEPSLRSERTRWRIWSEAVARTRSEYAVNIPAALRWPALVCLASLLIAIAADVPYDYFVLLRVLVFMTCAAIAYVLLKRNTVGTWFAFAAGIGVLYNPLLPIHLHRETWEGINILTVPYFLALTILITAE